MKLSRQPSYSSCWNSRCLLKAKPPAKETSCADFLGGGLIQSYLVPSRTASREFTEMHMMIKVI